MPGAATCYVMGVAQRMAAQKRACTQAATRYSDLLKLLKLAPQFCLLLSLMGFECFLIVKPKLLTCTLHTDLHVHCQCKFTDILFKNI